MRAKSLQSFLTLCSLMDCSLLGSSVHGVLQTRILEWVAISYSRGVFFTTSAKLLFPEDQCLAFADLVSHASFLPVFSQTLFPHCLGPDLSQADLQPVHVGTTHNPFPPSGCPFLLVRISRAFAYASLVSQTVKASAYNAGDLSSIPGSGKSLEKAMATHSSTLAWKIPWTEKPDRLPSMGSQRVGYN